MVAADARAFVRANLPAPPARILEIGAGNGELACALTVAGYDVIAIDPEPAGANVRTAALHRLDEPAASFDAAVAIVSLHHVDPLAESCRRLTEMLKAGGTLLVDELTSPPSTGAPPPGGSTSGTRLEQAKTKPPTSLSTSTAPTSTRSNGSSRHSSPTFKSARRCEAPGSTAGISTIHSALPRKN
jgi:ubiquinone/menaquinone biosynthesis C-methylase UbiE